MLPLIILILTFTGTYCQQEAQVLSLDDPNNVTIAFGSCLNTFEEDEKIDTALRAVINTEPDLWIWGGDVVYLDGDSFLLGTLPGPRYDISDEEYTRDIFNTLKENPTYVELRENIPVIGVWDDHDYAYDNMDTTFEYKERNKNIYLDFLHEPEDSPRRDQQGVYGSYYLGEDRLVKIILIDIRYNAEPSSTIGTLLDTDVTPNEFDDMLGDEQWAWLEAELQDDTPTYTLLVSGVQFLPDDRPVIENWTEDSKNRLFDLINTHQKSGVILLSGDVHYAEILSYPCPERVGYRTLYEFTSSGLTHSATEADIIDGVIPDTYSTEADRFFEKNFGVIRLVQQENSEEPPNLVFEARDLEGNVVLTREVLYSDVVYDAALAEGYTGCDLTSDESDSGKAVGVNDKEGEVYGEEENTWLEEENGEFVEEEGEVWTEWWTL